MVKKEMHYVYLDLGNRQFATIAIPKKDKKSTRRSHSQEHKR